MERTFATQFARLIIAGILTAIVISASCWQLVSSSSEAAPTAVTGAWRTR